jgi:hypothetical protein
LTQINARHAKAYPVLQGGHDWELVMALSDLKLPNSSLLENAPEHLKLIGLIAVNDAHLDRQLCRLYSLLAGLDSKTFLGRSPMDALTGEVLANIARRESLPQDKVVLLETCVGRVKRCRERLKQMSDSAFGVGQHGLITAPSSDECGNLMPFAKGELGLLADDIAECAEQFDRFCVYLRPCDLARNNAGQLDAARASPSGG